MVSPTDKPSLPVDAFLAAFGADLDSGAVRPLADYLAKFPGDDAAIAREYRSAMARAAAGRARSGAPTADRIGHYKTLRELGRGGQATVYLAEDTRLHRNVALKVLDVGPTANGQAIERFRRKAAISKLDHPGICPVYDIGQDRGVLYIAMRYVEGETLATRIACVRRMDGRSAAATRTSLHARCARSQSASAAICAQRGSMSMPWRLCSRMSAGVARLRFARLG
jgi:Protein kinase domain